MQLRPNLHWLSHLNYKNLSGIEISKAAVMQMKNSFPGLADSSEIFHGSLEDVLPGLPSNYADVLFSVATLQHVHPSSNFVFSEILRVARKYILIVESESANCGYIFIRNYRRFFEKQGCHQIKSTIITPGAFPRIPRYYDGYTIRLLTVPLPTEENP